MVRVAQILRQHMLDSDGALRQWENEGGRGRDFMEGATGKPMRKQWADVDIEKLAAEVVGRNGKFHIMVAFMGIALMPALMMDRNGRLIYMNKHAEDFWKVKIKKVLGQQFSEILRLTEKETDALDRQVRSVLAGGEPRVFLEQSGTDAARRQSVLKFPFTDDDDDVLLGAFILPHGTSLLEDTEPAA